MTLKPSLSFKTHTAGPTAVGPMKPLQGSTPIAGESWDDSLEKAPLGHPGLFRDLFEFRTSEAGENNL